MTIKTLFSLLAAFSLAAVTSAYAQDKASGNKTSAGSGTSKNASAQGSGAGGKNGASKANAAGGATQTIDVNMTDRGVQMPSTIPAGRVRFVVKDSGDLPHTIAITGGTLKNISMDASPAQTGTIEVDLTPGKYQAFCKTSGHQGKEAGASFTVK